MARLYNIARMTTATTGTGNITLGSAVAGFLTFAQAGIANGEVISYAIEDGNNREVGRGIYSSTGPTLQRAAISRSTNSNAAINLSGNAQVFIAAIAEDISPTSVADQATIRNNIFAAPYDAMASLNLVINGAMEISQEIGTAQKTLTTGDNGVLAYGPDQWASMKSASGSWALLQNADGVGSFTKALYLGAGGAVSLGSSDYLTLCTLIEGYRVARLGLGTAFAKTLTVGFWVKSSTTGTFTVGLGSNYPTASGSTYRHMMTINAANTWEFKTFALTGQSSGGAFAFGNTCGLCIWWCFGAGASRISASLDTWDQSAPGVPAGTGQSYFLPSGGNYVELTGVFVVPDADPLTSSQSVICHNDFDTELAACQRYYETSYDTNTPIATATSAGAHDHGVAVSASFGMPSTANLQSGTVRFNKVKRTTPSITIYSPASAAGAKARDVLNGVDVNATSAGVGYKSFQWFSQPNTAGNTHLQFHWVANARM